MTARVLYMLEAPYIYVKTTNTHEEEEKSPHRRTTSTLKHQELGDVFGHGQRAKYSFH